MNTLPERPERSNSQYELLEHFARENFDITFLFGKHGRSEDAEAILSYVEPSSVVLVEGMGWNPNELSTVLSHAWHLGRLSEADYAKHLARYKRETAENIVSEDWGPNAYPEFRFSLDGGLLDKKCLIMPADIYSPEHAQSEQIKAFLSNLMIIDDTVSADNGDISLGMSIRQEINSSRKHARTDAVRETAVKTALVSLSDSMQKLASDGSSLARLAATPDNRIKIYVVYGTAHSYMYHDYVKEGYTCNRVVIGDGSRPFSLSTQLIRHQRLHPTKHGLLELAERVAVAERVSQVLYSMLPLGLLNYDTANKIQCTVDRIIRGADAATLTQLYASSNTLLKYLHTELENKELENEVNFADRNFESALNTLGYNLRSMMSEFIGQPLET